MSVAGVTARIACCATLALNVTIGADHTQGGSVQVQQIPRDQPPPSARLMPTRTGTGSVSGRVIDGLSGMPLARARVRLMGAALGRGGSPPVALTDGQGRFSFGSLPAGPLSLAAEKSTYLSVTYPEAGRTIRASYRPTILKDGEAIELTLRMYHGGVITGRVLDSQGDLVENANVRALLLPRRRGGRLTPRNGGSTNDIGEFRLARLEPGSYLLLVNPAGPRNPDDPAETQPIPTYYPGVASQEEAQAITIERGQAAAADIVLLEGTPSLVSGSVVDASGEPVGRGAYVNARVVTKDPGGGYSWSSGGPVQPDGTFKVKLPPGEYDLEVNATVMPPGGGPPQPTDQQFGWVRVTVPVGPVADVVIRLGRSGTVSGRFVFEGTAPLPKDPRQVSISLFGGPGEMCRSGRPETAADWTFKIDGVFGVCTVNAMGGLGSWMLKAVTRGSENILDRPMTVRPGQDVRNVVVVFTDKRTSLTVSVTDDSGQPTKEYVALAFPVDNERWTMNSRYIQTYTPPPSELLAFRAQQRPASAAPAMGSPPVINAGFPGLPPGEYYVVAVEDIDREGIRDPALLAELAASATKVTLAEGAPQTVQLRVKKIQP